MSLRMMHSVRYVRVEKFLELVGGYTGKAVQRKIEEGVWCEGREYRRGPDGHIFMDLTGYEKWVEGQRQAA